ncbi:MAG: penicillin-binding protein 1C [Myxococcales bacterium]|nr:penicillin-binding protein 1C [Myxococcales bacterium]
MVEPTSRGRVHRRWRLVAVSFAALVAVAVALFWKLPVVRIDDPFSTVLLDRDGELLGARTAADEQWRFPPLDRLPERLSQALVVAEDHRFWQHPGVDPLAVLRAARQNVSNRRVVSGASTLTMQVVRLARKGQSRTIGEKLVESLLALRLERALTKEQILGLYLAHAPFGGNTVGAAAAAWRYFGRDVNRLTWAEVATLAVLPNNPANIHPGRNRAALRERRDRLLDALRDAGLFGEEDCRLAKAEPLPGAPLPLPALASHLLDRAQRGHPKGGWIRTTLAAPTQRRATEILTRHHGRLIEREIYGVAALVLELETGRAVAYIGNAGRGGRDERGVGQGEHVDIVQAPRSTGSVLKPFLHAAMLDAGELTPEQLVPDIPTSLGGYMPKNFRRTFSGAVPASAALARSLNVSATRLLSRFGVDRFYETLRAVGMTTLSRSASDYGTSLVLGGAEGSLWELTAMYAGLARTAALRPGDMASRFFPATWELTATPVSVTQSSPLSPGASWTTLQALLEVERPGAESAWREFGSGRTIAWKTGTSHGFRDAWAIGVSPRHAVGVWVGNADGAGRPGLMGFTAAAPILFELFNMFDDRGARFAQPSFDLERAAICGHSGMRAGPNCVHVRHGLLPRSSLSSPACPYCKLLPLDADGRLVHGDCESVSRIRPTPWFILPPTMETYYRARHPEYRPAPTLRPDCVARAQRPGALSIVYPSEDGSQLYVPVELDGRHGQIIFEAARRDPRGGLYWHLDGDYVGTTKGTHQMALTPAPGEHVLTVVSGDGESADRRFIILESE